MTAFDRGWQSLASLAAPLVERATRNRSEGATDMPLNCMTIDELRDLGKIISAVVDTGEELSLRNIEITADMTPGSVVTMTLVDCVVPVVMGEAVAEAAEVRAAAAEELESWQPLEDAIGELMLSERAVPTIVDGSMDLGGPAAIAAPAPGKSPEEAVREIMRLSEDFGAPISEARPAACADGLADMVKLGPVPEVIEAEPAEPAIPVSAPVADPAPTLKTGALDDDERATIQRLAAEGVSRPVIAERLGRRVQAVSAYLTSVEQARAKSEAMKDKARKMPAPVTVLPPLPAAPVVKVVPVQAAPAKPAQVGPDIQPLPGWQQIIWEHIDGLGYPGVWSAGLDLELVQGLARGTKLNMLAADFGIDSAALKARWAGLSACVREDNGRVSIEWQGRLLTVLKLRAQAKGAAA